MEKIRMLRRECNDCKVAFEHQVNTRSMKDIVLVAKYLQILAGSHEQLMEHRVGRPEFKTVLKVD